jgi:hypothetical protein
MSNCSCSISEVHQNVHYKIYLEFFFHPDILVILFSSRIMLQQYKIPSINSKESSQESPLGQSDALFLKLPE